MIGIKNLSSRSLIVSAAESRAAAECSSIAEDFLLVSVREELFFEDVDMSRNAFILCCYVMLCYIILRCDIL